MEPRTQTFIDALHELERSGDVERMAALFAPDAQVGNPHLDTPMTGSDGARRFWEDYRGAFGQVSSEFLNTINDTDVSALEWRSTGTLRPNNQPFTYGGVSMIEWSGNQIRRFAAYFDPSALQIERDIDAAHLSPAHDAGRETPEHYG